MMDYLYYARENRNFSKWRKAKRSITCKRLSNFVKSLSNVFDLVKDLFIVENWYRKKNNRLFFFRKKERLIYSITGHASSVCI